MDVVVLRPDRHLTRMSRERSARAHGYVIRDRVAKKLVLCCQRLNLAADYINSLQLGGRVSPASLYEAAKYGRDVHRRWQVTRKALDETATCFEEARREAPDAKAVCVVAPFRLTVG